MAPKDPTPSLSPAPGVPPSGNAKFIIIAVLLLGVIGGLVAWKLSQKPPEAVVVAADASPPPRPTKNLDDDIPLPVVLPDAGSADAGEKKVAAGAYAGNLCDAKQCSGGSSSDIESALAFRAKQAHRCYDNALAQDPTLRGKVSISVRIGANGQACSASVANNELASAPAVASCVAGYFRGQSFPTPRGGCLDVNIPINFVPRQ